MDSKNVERLLDAEQNILVRLEKLLTLSWNKQNLHAVATNKDHDKDCVTCAWINSCRNELKIIRKALMAELGVDTAVRSQSEEEEYINQLEEDLNRANKRIAEQDERLEKYEDTYDILA